MKLSITLDEETYELDSKEFTDLSIPMFFDGAQPNLYGVAKASARAYEDGEFVGDTRRGGSCNFETYTLNPHCNGTHTECVGHIVNQRIAIAQVVTDILIPTTLITVEPEIAIHTADRYDPSFGEDDLVISAKSLFYQLQHGDRAFLEAVMIRTTPNETSKKQRDYTAWPAPFFTHDAIKYLLDIGVRHLITDTPSIDRMRDEGRLSSHHIFWGVPQGFHECDAKIHSNNTVTEMVYIPDEIRDGNYFTTIQIPPFVADAAPSRILIHPIVKSEDFK